MVRSNAVQAAALAAAFVFGAAENTYAADRFAVISIDNATNATVTVTYRWGTQSKKNHTFTPGQRHWFSYKYDSPSSPSSPDFFISFDSDVRGGKYIEDKRLHGFRAPEENYDLGHKYTFRYDGPSKRYIELYDSSRR